MLLRPFRSTLHLVKFCSALLPPPCCLDVGILHTVPPLPAENGLLSQIVNFDLSSCTQRRLSLQIVAAMLLLAVAFLLGAPLSRRGGSTSGTASAAAAMPTHFKGLPSMRCNAYLGDVCIPPDAELVDATTYPRIKAGTRKRLRLLGSTARGSVHVYNDVVRLRIPPTPTVGQPSSAHALPPSSHRRHASTTGDDLRHMAPVAAQVAPSAHASATSRASCLQPPMGRSHAGRTLVGTAHLPELVQQAVTRVLAAHTPAAEIPAHAILATASLPSCVEGHATNELMPHLASLFDTSLVAVRNSGAEILTAACRGMLAASSALADAADNAVSSAVAALVAAGRAACTAVVARVDGTTAAFKLAYVTIRTVTMVLAAAASDAADSVLATVQRVDAYTHGAAAVAAHAALLTLRVQNDAHGSISGSSSKSAPSSPVDFWFDVMACMLWCLVAVLRAACKVVTTLPAVVLRVCWRVVAALAPLLIPTCALAGCCYGYACAPPLVRGQVLAVLQLCLALLRALYNARFNWAWLAYLSLYFRPVSFLPRAFDLRWALLYGLSTERVGSPIVQLISFAAKWLMVGSAYAAHSVLKRCLLAQGFSEQELQQLCFWSRFYINKAFKDVEQDWQVQLGMYGSRSDYVLPAFMNAKILVIICYLLQAVALVCLLDTLHQRVAAARAAYTKRLRNFKMPAQARRHAAAAAVRKRGPTASKATLRRTCSSIASSSSMQASGSLPNSPRIRAGFVPPFAPDASLANADDSRVRLLQDLTDTTAWPGRALCTFARNLACMQHCKLSAGFVPHLCAHHMI